MSAPDVNLDFTEQAVFSLRALYNRYGYTQYKMGKFEEYDLYARNKDFLISDSVITFTDLNGKLMALKPDVTLSIVKNTTDRPEDLQKLYYNENVYRVSKGSRSFREITQVGLESLGRIDDYCILEVLLLAARSLQCISPDAILDISHLGLLSRLIDSLGIRPEDKPKLLSCIGDKNLHDLARLCRESGMAAGDLELLTGLVNLSGPINEVLPQIAALLQGRADVATLSSFTRILSSLAGTDLAPMLRLDFSVVDDIHYYNGFVFKGFVDGLPVSILSGGQYDKLMAKMGRRSGAIGFAVYMDQIGRLAKSPSEYDVDTVLLYNDDADLTALYHTIDTLSAAGSVTARQQKPENIRYRRLLKLQGSEVAELENNA